MPYWLQIEDVSVQLWALTVVTTESHATQLICAGDAGPFAMKWARQLEGQLLVAVFDLFRSADKYFGCPLLGSVATGISWKRRGLTIGIGLGVCISERAKSADLHSCE
jgi:hypothetical protein